MQRGERRTRKTNSSCRKVGTREGEDPGSCGGTGKILQNGGFLELETFLYVFQRKVGGEIGEGPGDSKS